MYDFVTHTHAHLGGECPHRCVYCYVDNPRFGRPEKYTGEIRIIEKELAVNYGSGKKIFVENCGDMFAVKVPHEFILKILEHCCRYPDNIYIFQSKNPARFKEYTDLFPPRIMLGTTAETNHSHSFVHPVGLISLAPPPVERCGAMAGIYRRKFITIEPILDFDVDAFAQMLIMARPSFINIGADSKGHGLPEPDFEKVEALIAKLKKAGIEIREKHNLERLKNEGLADDI